MHTAARGAKGGAKGGGGTHTHTDRRKTRKTDGQPRVCACELLATVRVVLWCCPPGDRRAVWTVCLHSVCCPAMAPMCRPYPRISRGIRPAVATRHTPAVVGVAVSLRSFWNRQSHCDSPSRRVCPVPCAPSAGVSVECKALVRSARLPLTSAVPSCPAHGPDSLPVGLPLPQHTQGSRDSAIPSPQARPALIPVHSLSLSAAPCPPWVWCPILVQAAL